MIINGKDAIFGRLATIVAKKALLGETIDIVNCEKIIISGKKEVIFEKYLHRKKGMGTPVKGPFYSSNTEKFVKRLIRGMLPYKKDKGMSAFKRIKCHKGVPAEFEGKDFEIISQSKLRTRFVTIEQICKFIGGKE